MRQTDDSFFSVEFGRVGQSPQQTKYPISKWDSIKNSKLRKGYVDVTELQSEEIVSDTLLTGNTKIDEMLTYLLSASKVAYASTYSISGTSITVKQITEAQSILDNITLNQSDLDAMRKLYLRLFTVIPRTMQDVRTSLPNSITEALQMHAKEQSNIDNAGVQQAFTSNNQEKLLDKLGVKISESDLTTEIIEILQGNEKDIKAVFKLEKPETEASYNQWIEAAKHKKQIVGWHGTDVSNILSIMQSSLRVRPTVIAHGSMLGNAAYFSEEWKKSRNYTYGTRAFMFVFRIHVGNELIANKRSLIKTYTAAELQQNGYDSVFAPAGVDTGWFKLRYSERTVYNSEQLTPAYLIEVK